LYFWFNVPSVEVILTITFRIFEDIMQHTHKLRHSQRQHKSKNILQLIHQLNESLYFHSA